MKSLVYAICLLAFFLPGNSLAQNSPYDVWPFNDLREWRLADGTTVKGYCRIREDGRGRPVSIKYTTTMGNASHTRELSEKQIHPAEKIWIYHAAEWMAYEGEGFPKPDPAKYNLPEGNPDRTQFPAYVMADIGAVPNSFARCLASYALWWDQVGFFKIPEEGDLIEKCNWISKEMDRRFNRREDVSADLSELIGPSTEFLEKGYRQDVVLATKTLPYVDTEVLSHYTRGYDAVVMAVVYAKGRSITKWIDARSAFNWSPVTVCSVDDQGRIEFLHGSTRMVAKLIPVDPAEISGGVPIGTMELKLLNLPELSDFWNDEENRLLVNIDRRHPLWVVRPYRLKSPEFASDPPPPIRPPDMNEYRIDSGDREGPMSEGKGGSGFSLTETYQPRPITYSNSLPGKAREFTDTSGKTLKAVFVDKAQQAGEEIFKLTTATGEVEIPTERFSAADLNYVRFQKTPEEKQAGRLLYRIRKPYFEGFTWIELRYSANHVVARILDGEEFPVEEKGLLSSALELVTGPADDTFRLDFPSLRWEEYVASTKKTRRGSIPTTWFDLFGRESKLPAVVSGAAHVEVDGFPGQVFATSQGRRTINQLYETDIVTTRVRSGAVPTFWYVFAKSAEFHSTERMKVASNYFEDFFQRGLIPLEMTFKPLSAPGDAFQLKLVEADFDQPGPSEFTIPQREK